MKNTKTLLNKKATIKKIFNSYKSVVNAELKIYKFKTKRYIFKIASSISNKLARIQLEIKLFNFFYYFQSWTYSILS